MPYTCLLCAKVFTPLYPSKHTHKYCSLVCSGRAQKGKRKPRVLPPDVAHMRDKAVLLRLDGYGSMRIGQMLGVSSYRVNGWIKDIHAPEIRSTAKPSAPNPRCLDCGVELTTRGSLRCKTHHMVYMQQCRRHTPEEAEAADRHKREYKAKWFQANKDRVRAQKRANPTSPDVIKSYSLVYNYGITLEDRDAKIVEQEGKCPICLCRFDLTVNTGKYSANVDHNHVTDELRGVLCNRCNMAIGLVDESCETLERAIKYLKEATWNVS